jgi:uncharacterized protein YjbI with pentapeptide repeats
MTVLRRRTRFWGHGEPERLDLRSTHLREANLQGARLQGANLYRTNLQETILQGATGMAQEQIQWTLGSNKTQLPQDLNRPELWSKDIEEQRRILDELIGGG